MKHGLLPYCRDCLHRDRQMADAGHPRPCREARWDGPRLVLPVADEAGCESFRPLPEDAAETVTAQVHIPAIFDEWPERHRSLIPGILIELAENNNRRNERPKSAKTRRQALGMDVADVLNAAILHERR